VQIQEIVGMANMQCVEDGLKNAMKIMADTNCKVEGSGS
jgi:hypothetical protein